jgi:hypothetical protein
MAQSFPSLQRQHGRTVSQKSFGFSAVRVLSPSSRRAAAADGRALSAPPWGPLQRARARGAGRCRRRRLRPQGTGHGARRLPAVGARPHGADARRPLGRAGPKRGGRLATDAGGSHGTRAPSPLRPSAGIHSRPGMRVLLPTGHCHRMAGHASAAGQRGTELVRRSIS